ncbi:MAG: DUF1552 domain-containing protein [Planctomycetaceae bacterium]
MFHFGRQLNRRTLLRGTGVSLALPWLTAMRPAFAGTEDSTAPRRFVAMTLGLGLLGENLNPATGGFDYEPGVYLRPLQDIRDRFTVISGSSHPGVKGGHRAEASLLTANPVGSSGRAKNSISVDQLMAKHAGNQTRFPSLVLSSSGSNSPSYTENGAMIPALDSPAKLFSQLFVDDSPTEQKRQADRVQQGRSIMDVVAEDAQRLSRKLGAGDRDRLDAYFTSVRELERRMTASAQWSELPKPKVKAARPVDIGNANDFVGRQKLMSDVIRLALETDSTRFISYHLGGSGGVVPIPGVHEGYHALSHHGRDEEKLDQLALVEENIVGAWGQFCRDLMAVNEQGEAVLDNTCVLLTSNLGNASNHDNRNMPVLLAGGRFRHGQHLAFDTNNNYPLPNLFVNLLQHSGVETDTFATSTGTVSGLESL